jgi:hypothetical protein
MSEGEETPLASYQYAIRQLTAENKRLRRELATIKLMHQRITRKLRAERDEGLSPELAALRRELQHWRQRAVAAEGRLASVRRSVA